MQQYHHECNKTPVHYIYASFAGVGQRVADSKETGWSSSQDANPTNSTARIDDTKI
jgi:hypothetical protein